MNRSQIKNVWLTDTSVWIELKDGRRAEERFSNYHRLAESTETERQNFKLSHFGIHWPDLDEDLSYEGFFAKQNNGIEASEKA